MTKLFKNANIILKDKIIYGNLLVEDNLIKEIDTKVLTADEIIDVDGKYLSPGFIDIHLHGGGGHDFMEATEKAILKITEAHLKNGTTSMYPTTVAASLTNLENVILSVRNANSKNLTKTRLLGVHLEGPYFSMNKRGAHEIEQLRNPDKKEYEYLVNNYPEIKRWTIACELDGAIELGNFLKSKNINASIGHSDASFKDCINAFNNGYTSMTHFYNAMSSTYKKGAFRYAGCVEAGYIDDDIYTEVICDGLHVTSDLLKLIYKNKTSEKMILITDSMMASCCPDGNYFIGSEKAGLKAVKKDNAAYVEDFSCLAGSVATTNLLVRTIKNLNIPLYEAVKMVTYTPAKLMNLEKLGSLEVNKYADLIIFDENINVTSAYIDGKKVF